MKVVSYEEVKKFIEDFLNTRQNSIVEEECKNILRCIEGRVVNELELAQEFNDAYMSAMYRCRSYTQKVWDISLYRAACLYAELQKESHKLFR